MAQTLDQKRAEYAWKRATEARRDRGDEFENYKNLAKGAPALIMGNGLMPALAFYKSRGKGHATVLLTDIAGWLASMRVLDEVVLPPRQLPNSTTPQDRLFSETMQRLHHAPSQTYMRATDETLAMLKWLRQFADAVAWSQGG